MNLRHHTLRISFLLIILISGCGKDQYPNDEDLQAGNGRLKRILLYQSIEAEEPIAISELYEYDELGRISRVWAPAYEDGSSTGTLWYDLYEYGDSGQLTGKKNFNANRNDPSGFVNLKNFTYIYSSDGNRTEERIDYPLAGLQEHTLFTYYRDKLTKAEKYGNGNNLESYIIYAYDHQGRLITGHLYDGSGLLLGFTTHTWEGGLETRSDEYSIWGSRRTHVREIIRYYDENHNLSALESHELSLYSSRADFVLKYEYFDY